jgi:hypothetical protein
MSLGGLTGAAGQIAAASMQADAIKTATQMQIDAIERQKQYLYANLDPSVVNNQALGADANLAANRLALQGLIDPNLLSTRRAAEQGLLEQVGQVGKGNAAAVSGAATGEALAGTPGMNEAKQKLIEAANKELEAGATLPPDVQAELVKAGLEKSGMVTGHASAQGTGGQILRTILGTAGVQLQQQRQKQAAGLLESAQNLTASRASILQNLFPSLTSTQLQNLQGTAGALGTADSLAPNAGLSGSNIANIWLARVGATNQLTQQGAQAAANGAMGLGNVWGSAIGGGANALGNSGAGQILSGWLSGNNSGGGGYTNAGVDSYLNGAGW